MNSYMTEETVSYDAHVGVGAEALVSEFGVGDWCHPGDQQRRTWLLLFDDAERGRCVYYDEAEAHDAFRRAEGIGYNFHLFSSVPRRLRANAF